MSKQASGIRKRKVTASTHLNRKLAKIKSLFNRRFEKWAREQAILNYANAFANDPDAEITAFLQEQG